MLNYVLRNIHDTFNPLLKVTIGIAGGFHLPLQVQQCVDDLLEHVDHIEVNIAGYDRILFRMGKTDHRSQRLMELKGIGPTTPVRLLPVSVMHIHNLY